MAAKTYTELTDRGLISVGGAGAREFLQALVSNDIDRAGPERAVYATLLTPQGKFLYDFFVCELDGRLVLDCEAARRDELIKRLTFYRLRAKVELADAGADRKVFALFGDGAAEVLDLTEEPGAAKPFAGGLVMVDPRLAALGLRAIVAADGAQAALAAAGFTAAAPADYDRHRLALGVPDGSRDVAVDRNFLLEGNFEALNAVDFGKGCYVGQELTARTKYRGTIKKRLYPVEVDGPLPDPGTAITFDGADAGEMRSGLDGRGIALLRLEQVAKAAAAGRPLAAGTARLTPVKPAWADWAD